MKKRTAERAKSRGILKNALLLIPNFLKLFYRMLRDSRVPLAEKAMVVGTIAYVISPLDFIPDFIPFVGQVDDLYLVALVLLRLLTRTDESVVREHWDGAGDIAALADRIARAARYILPKKVQSVILGRVDIAPQIKGGLISSPAAPELLEPIDRMPRR
jgi:uncharacterized membrane protein YkvA (DUF1232 family)